MNKVILVGRLISINEDNSLTIRIEEREGYTIGKVFISDKIINTLKEYNKVNSVIAINGKISNKDNQFIIVAEKVLFLN